MPTFASYMHTHTHTHIYSQIQSLLWESPVHVNCKDTR